MKITVKLKIADLEDIFYGDIRKGTSPHGLKPYIPHYLLEDGALNGVYFTPDSITLDVFSKYLQLVFSQKILIINNFYSVSPFTSEINLERATEDWFHAFSPYFVKRGNEISGPFVLGEEYHSLNPRFYKNKPIIEEFNNGNIYLVAI
ncbi:hypothetical protein [Myroides odoratimimus]|uniref:Uncharacterized protein n=1 Tax=Myroides odoratimimus CIP 101113 TaxID=883154 RepID=A0AAV3F508_9FLAO|nr:hypothetical protein [Myroides odoratimimus]EHO13855.1 hypothetical protein HMPREF9715_00929 [Myroides odoratimimus CIP 101113]